MYVKHIFESKNANSSHTDKILIYNYASVCHDNETKKMDYLWFYGPINKYSIMKDGV